MYELSVGSKVFLFGEYQVLKTGKAFLTTLEPRFKLQIKQLQFNRGSGKVQGIPEGSPADRFLKKESLFFSAWDLVFIDPHLGAGGFGASTAQFALVHGFKEAHSSINTQAEVRMDLRKLHQDYLSAAFLQSGVQPSGADILAQVQGGLVEVDFKSGKVQRHSWPFTSHQFLFFATGNKLATHTHLSALSSDLNMEDLETLYNQTFESFNQQNIIHFAESLNQYQMGLKQKGWLSDATQKSLNELGSMDGVLAAKGCGAMGNDVIAVLVLNKDQELVKAKGEAIGLKYIGNLDQRTDGFQAQWIPT